MNIPNIPDLHYLILAYRKVKAELWWASGVPSIRLLAEYEQDLVGNLSKLRSRLKDDFYPDRVFLGSVYYLPKKVIPKEETPDPLHYRMLADKCPAGLKEGKMFQLELRQIAVPSIDFQVLSVLWAMGEGGDIDARRSTSSRAYVLRRNYVPDAEGQFPDVEMTLRGPVNLHYPGLYKTYFNAYKQWRNDGLTIAKKALENGQRIFALTMDLRRYYHQIDACCLQNKLGKGTIATSLAKSLIAWQNEFGEPDENDAETSNSVIKRGIPVGLIASGLIANLLLDPLDQAIERRLNPIYYGRYVDDLFLVFSLNGKFLNGSSLLSEFARLLHGDKGREPSMFWHQPNKSNKEGRIEFKYAPWKNSLLESKADKQRIFCLEGRKGLDLLAVLDKELIENSSEWRLLRESFYRVAETHLLNPEGLSDFWPKLDRLFGLVFTNGDWKAANRLLTRLISAKSFRFRTSTWIELATVNATAGIQKKVRLMISYILNFL